MEKIFILIVLTLSQGGYSESYPTHAFFQGKKSRQNKFLRKLW